MLGVRASSVLVWCFCHGLLALLPEYYTNHAAEVPFPSKEDVKVPVHLLQLVPSPIQSARFCVPKPAFLLAKYYRIAHNLKDCKLERPTLPFRNQHSCCNPPITKSSFLLTGKVRDRINLTRHFLKANFVCNHSYL